MNSSLVNEMLKDISYDNPYIGEFKTNNKLILKKSKNVIDYNPTELRISTITALSSIGVLVDTNKLYEKFDMEYNRGKLNNYLDGNLDRSEFPLIITIQKSNTVFKGIDNGKKKKKKDDLTTGFKKKRDSFQNQLTFIVAISNNKNINVKLFKNGKIQMTGLRSEEDGYIAVNNLISNIKHIDGISENNKLMECGDLNIILINSDFDLGFKIKRDELFKLMGENGVYVVYEPDIYPGVNSKYYFNKNNTNIKKEGICSCIKECNGKGCGEGNGECKKITIAIFQSGSIIITGSKTHEQMTLAYNFINRLIYNNIETIKKNDIYIPKCQIEGKNKVYYIKKNNIQNIESMNIHLR